MKTVYYTDYMNEDELDSSALAAAWYDSKNRELYVQFHTGKIAGYKGVALYRWNDFKNADSHGAYYTHNIKNHYSGIPGEVQFHAALSTNYTSSSVYTTAPTYKDSFKVTVGFTGDLEFTIDADSLAEAIQAVTDTMIAAKAGDNYKIKKVELA